MIPEPKMETGIYKWDNL